MHRRLVTASVRSGTYVITGGNRGLGLEIARALATHPEVRVVLGVRNPEATLTALQAAGLSTSNIRCEELDVGSLASVRAFCARWNDIRREPITALINNAGIQCNGPTRTTREGFEETFAVNYLGALTLTLGLSDALAAGHGRVLFIGSGTHDSRHIMARLSGFRGAQFTSLEAAAHGAPVDSRAATNDRQSGLDRYATSKLLCTTVALALSRRAAEATTPITYFVLDPGMLPGTGLAREAPPALQFAWKWLLPPLHCVLPDTTTPQRAAAAAAWLAASSKIGQASGSVLNYAATASRYVAAEARDPVFADAVLRDSLALIEQHRAA